MQRKAYKITCFLKKKLKGGKRRIWGKKESHVEVLQLARTEAQVSPPCRSQPSMGTLREVPPGVGLGADKQRWPTASSGRHGLSHP